MCNGTTHSGIHLAQKSGTRRRRQPQTAQTLQLRNAQRPGGRTPEESAKAGECLLARQVGSATRQGSAAAGR